MSVINVTDKIKIRNLEFKVSRLENDAMTHLDTIHKLRIERYSTDIILDRLREENAELKKHLKALEVEVVYG